MQDILNLTPGEYGLPYASNFALVDAIIQPNILLQFTVAKKHRAATHSLSELRKCLKGKNNEHMMIFIVEDVAKFCKQDGLDDIKQFAMSYEDINQDVAGLDIINVKLGILQ